MIYTVVSCWLVLVLPVAAETDEKLGDTGDGSRAVPVHLIPLFDEQAPLFDKESQKILQDDELFLPFSTRQTCGGDCHSYDAISKGWHFNAADPNVAAGRPGQPWIFVDARTAIQIPLSYRHWPGTFRPEQFGITTWQFTNLFGRQMPGGGPGELLDQTDNIDEIMRSFVSGKLEINCLSCHNADPYYNQAEYAGQIARQNFRWAATAACDFASVSGLAGKMPSSYLYLMPPPGNPDAPVVSYREGVFDRKNQVWFNIVREVPVERCYFCHSNVVFGAPKRKESRSSNSPDEGSLEKWMAEEDVHLKAGLTCVDCHNNGLDHNITRGYRNEASDSANPLVAVSSCQGCHLGEKSSVPMAGRLGAPVPKHPGIPLLHFDKLTCTACHSGPWPTKETHRIKTSRTHGLGTYNVNKSEEALPHIISLVFAEQSDGRIGPHNLIWPAFWANLKGREVAPIALETVRPIVRKIITSKRVPASGDWPSLTEEDIVKVLTSLSSQEPTKGISVYICGGKLCRLDDSGRLLEEDHPAAEPYLWPIAHNVRPAAQSLGVRRCEDCHSTDAPFSFGEVAVDSPLVSGQGRFREMVKFQDINRSYAKIFAFTFVFRPLLKIVALASCAVLAVVLLLYALKALTCIAKIMVGED